MRHVSFPRMEKKTFRNHLYRNHRTLLEADKTHIFLPLQETQAVRESSLNRPIPSHCTPENQSYTEQLWSYLNGKTVNDIECRREERHIYVDPTFEQKFFRSASETFGEIIHFLDPAVHWMLELPWMGKLIAAALLAYLVALWIGRDVTILWGLLSIGSSRPWATRLPVSSYLVCYS